MELSYAIPTKVFAGNNIILQKSDFLTNLGTRALLVTGHSSAQKSGALADVENILAKQQISYAIFSDVEENPSMETVIQGAKIAQKKEIDFVVGIGGGSPLDAAKAISIMAASKCSEETLFTQSGLDYFPVAAIPTTAGTGSEITPYAVITDWKSRRKRTLPTNLFPEVCFLDANYTASVPPQVAVNTAIDALSHLIEGYLTRNTNPYSDALAEKGLAIFAECLQFIQERKFQQEVREKLLLASNLAGMVIAIARTSIPHFLGYQLTLEKGIAHGKANGLLLQSFLAFHQDQKRVKIILEKLGFVNLSELGSFLKEILSVGSEEHFTEADLQLYLQNAANNLEKLRNHPYPATVEDLYTIYEESLLN
ncbi:iron-containing alcohol dehydrogenase family protein [Bacillota bacterium LX-D]|nr:iron-containing alcohol dehydrogenase family protein [Bacillota bacterium LX-D]